MDTEENVTSTVDQPLHTEQNPQETVPTGGDFLQQDNSRKCIQAAAHKRSAVRTAGFLFWTNFAGVLLLLVGFVAPGWITVRTLQKVYKSYSETPLYLSGVYQDYALWYVTQCYEHDGNNEMCETMTYRTIDGVYGEGNGNYEKIIIEGMEIFGEDIFMFNGAVLVFSFSQLVRAQTLYTIGVLIALFTLYNWYQFRTAVANNKGMRELKWVFLLLLTIVDVLFLLIPVFMVVEIHGNLRRDGHADKSEILLGSIFASCGGGLLALNAITVFLQIVYCRQKDWYICIWEDESDMIPVQVVDD